MDVCDVKKTDSENKQLLASKKNKPTLPIMCVPHKLKC